MIHKETPKTPSRYCFRESLADKEYVKSSRCVTKCFETAEDNHNVGEKVYKWKSTVAQFNCSQNIGKESDSR